MIQFNLLPDVKIQYLKAESQKKIIVTVSVLVSGFFFLLLLFLLLFVKVGQTHHIDALTKDINKQTNELKKVNDLDKILTIQNQLNSLPDLHAKKAITSRLFDYLVQITPIKATISDATLDVAEAKLSIQGNADSLATVNKFVDTVKFTDYRLGSADAKKAFSNVVLTSFSVSDAGSSQANKRVTYQIDFNFDPIIFTNNVDAQGKPAEVKISVPNIISTRSEVDKPGAVFDDQPSQNRGNN